MGYVRRKLPQKMRHRLWTIDKLVAAYGGICYLCLEPFKSKKDITLDHLLARSKGGGDELTNLRLAHEKCNNAKKDMSLEEYVVLQEGF